MKTIETPTKETYMKTETIPGTLDEYIAAYQAPYQHLSISYSHNTDDEWVQRRRKTCLSEPGKLREIAGKYYAEWRDLSLLPLSDAAPKMKELIARIERNESPIDDATRDLVKFRMTYDPPVCNEDTLCVGGHKGYLDALWAALINSPSAATLEARKTMPDRAKQALSTPRESRSLNEWSTLTYHIHSIGRGSYSPSSLRELSDPEIAALLV